MKRSIKIVIVLLVIVSLGALYIGGRKTYTAYESAVDQDLNIDIAKWEIYLDGKNITSSNKAISLKNIEWEGEHIREGKVAPGSKGIVKVEIIPKTDVALKYLISYKDHSVDPKIILTVNSITLDGENAQIVDNTLSGVVTLEQINNNKKLMLTLEVEWADNEDHDVEEFRNNLNGKKANYLFLNFDASQYMGE